MKRLHHSRLTTKKITEPELSADFVVVMARVYDFGPLRLYWKVGDWTIRLRGGPGYWTIPIPDPDDPSAEILDEDALREKLESILADLREEIA